MLIGDEMDISEYNTVFMQRIKDAFEHQENKNKREQPQSNSGDNMHPANPSEANLGNMHEGVLSRSDTLSSFCGPQDDP